MEIFTNEFKNELSKQLEELTNVVKTNKEELKKDGAVVMSDYEIAKFMDACMNNSDCSKKEKKKKKNQFEEGDVVYWGKIKGIVIKKFINNNNDFVLYVKFENKQNMWFTKDGRCRYFEGLPIVLSYFPYKLKMKKIK
jgi:co-chaperonin GroES (HSP10)